MDHGIPWWSQKSPSGITRLTVWLMKQGIRLHWSGFRHPQTQGKVGRFHGTLERALLLREAPRQQPQPWLELKKTTRVAELRCMKIESLALSLR